MTFSVFMDGGISMPKADTWRQRLWLRGGRYLATRHAGVPIDASCRVHPEARIHPRGGRLSIGARSSVAAGAVIQGQVTIGEDSSVQTSTILVGYGEAGSITRRRVSIISSFKKEVGLVISKFAISYCFMKQYNTHVR